MDPLLRTSLALVVAFCGLHPVHAQTVEATSLAVTDSDWWPVWILALVAALLAATFWNRRLAHEKRERRRLEQRLADLGGALPVGLFEARAYPDGQVRLLYSNKAARALLRLEPGQITITFQDQIFTSYLHADDESRVREAIKRSIESLEPIEEVFRYLSSQGDYRWMRADAAVRAMDDGGIIWTGSISDLSRERELQAEIDHLKASKDYFFAAASHELRTPVHTIGLSLERLALSDKSVDKTALDSASQACASLRALLDELLELARVQPDELVLNPGEFSLGALLKSLDDEFRSAFDRKSIALILSVSPGVPDLLNADSRRLRQILANLLMNALHFSEAGTVTLSVSLAAPQSGSGSRGGSFQLQFSVADHGQGLAADQLERVFEPFVSIQSIASDALLRTRFEQASSGIGSTGTGLGLAICRRIIERMGGRIWLESMPERGTVARFQIPQQRLSAPPARSDPARMATPAATHTSEQTRGLKRRRILLVDDDRLSRSLMANLLSSEGYLVTEAGSGEEALKKFKRGQFDAVVTDLRMPGMDGETLAAKIHALYQFDPVGADAEGRGQPHGNTGLTSRPRLIALTASLGGGDAGHRGEELFDRRLQKPVGVEELVEELEL